MTTTIEHVDGLEILDSRGNPTLRVRLTLADGSVGTASIPSGASTGSNEALELRDGDARYGGKGVRAALEHVRGELAEAIVGLDATEQAAVDQALLACDGTPGKTRLGANAILGCSLAAARAAAESLGLPLYAWLGGPAARTLPVPMLNILNGGAHADNRVDIQEFMVYPRGLPNFAEGLRAGAEVFHALKGLLRKRGLATGVGDEGGFAPDLKNDEEACALLVEAIEKAGYRPGDDLALCLDVAASSFGDRRGYELKKSGGGKRTAAQLIETYQRWAGTYPLVSIEDGLAEDDWDGFRALMQALGDRLQIVGDDLFVTNPEFIARGIRAGAANAVLIKVNQIGTLTETIDAVELCRRAGWNYVISHRSGETEDSFIADLAVALGGGQIKTGSACRSERVAKYNRLLEIEAALGPAARYGR